jgi:MFS transporter, ACS family, pantothenate transporter
MKLCWGVLTCCLSVVSNYQQVYGIRFLIGFCEGVTWPGYYTILRYARLFTRVKHAENMGS